MERYEGVCDSMSTNFDIDNREVSQCLPVEQVNFQLLYIMDYMRKPRLVHLKPCLQGKISTV